MPIPLYTTMSLVTLSSRPWTVMITSPEIRLPSESVTLNGIIGWSYSSAVVFSTFMIGIFLVSLSDTISSDLTSSTFVSEDSSLISPLLLHSIVHHPNLPVAQMTHWQY